MFQWKRGPVSESLLKLPLVVRPFLFSKKSPISKHIKDLERIKIWSWVPTGPKTTTDSAGNGQQQFT
jgi:hypothetical protein